MSLHDMYFSKKNKNHIFSVIQDLVLKETGTDINQNMDYIDLYRIKYSLIFERIDTDDLIILNKALIDELGTLFINDIRSKYKKEKIKIIPNSNEQMNTDTTKDISEYQELFIHSSERLTNSSNRYSYSIRLKDYINEFYCEEVTIPVENNILFINPLICIVILIEGKEYHNYCKLSNKIELNGYHYNVYSPVRKLKINCETKDIQINILNYNLKLGDNRSDKIMIKKIKKINYKNIDYLGIEVKGEHHFKEMDSIGIYKNDTLDKTYLIDKVNGKFLLIIDSEYEFNPENNYSILNMGIQNNILFYCIYGKK